MEELRVDIVVELVKILKGTYMSFSEACESLGLKDSDLSMEELLDFDSELICCESCGWWYPSCETDNEICDSCRRDEDEEDEDEDLEEDEDESEED